MLLCFRRTKNVLTKIKNQKDCGACWAFSSVETVESMNAIKRGKLEELSVQQLIDCAGYDNNGCNGGDICTILYWLDDNSIEIERNDQYPLKWKSDVCQFNRTIHGVSIADFSCNRYKIFVKYMTSVKKYPTINLKKKLIY